MNADHAARIAAAAIALSPPFVSLSSLSACVGVLFARDSDRFCRAPDLARQAPGDMPRGRLVPATEYPGATAWQLLCRSADSPGRRPVTAWTGRWCRIRRSSIPSARSARARTACSTANCRKDPR